MSDLTLVTGGTGKVGRRLVPALLERGTAVRVASRRPSAPPGAEATAFDWYDEATWAPALEGVERVFLVGPAFDADPDRVMLPFLERAGDAGVRRIVLLSAAGVEHGPEAGMRKVELALEEAGGAVILRPTWFMQNFSEGVFRPAVEAGVIALPAGDAPVAFVDVGDVAAVAAVALTEDGHRSASTLTGPEALTHAQVAALLSQATGRSITYQDVPPEAFRATLLDAGVPEAYAELLVALFAEVRAGRAATVSADVEQVTGRPARSFHNFLTEAADALR